MEFHLYLPQMRLSLDALTERAQAAEKAGFAGIALMDHLAPPLAEGQDMIDAMVAATWLAANTTTLTISHLVLCDTFRHPTMLSRQVVSLDHASGGRFELGIGWGSVPSEFETFGIGDTTPRRRVARLRESLEVLNELWAAEPVTYQGEYHQLNNALQRPAPLGKIPIVIGGAGPKTLQLVSDFADWWNCPTHRMADFDKMKERVGSARISIQQMTSLVHNETDREETLGLAAKRFGPPTYRAEGTAPELVDQYRAMQDKGVERVYVWFTDFAPDHTLAAFGNQVIAQV